MLFKNRCLTVLFMLLGFFYSAEATFNFSSRSSTLRVAGDLSGASPSKFVVNSAITGFDGTLELLDNGADRVQGAETITFASGILESGGLHAFLTGIYNPATTDTIQLTGSHRLRV
ncbi:hypothetical protein HOD08_04615 [bacterium]|nr:hypothetical protein [bacterium]